jgi:hypothetical protein
MVEIARARWIDRHQRHVDAIAPGLPACSRVRLRAHVAVELLGYARLAADRFQPVPQRGRWIDADPPGRHPATVPRHQTFERATSA